MKKYLLRLLKQQLDRENGYLKNADKNATRNSEVEYWQNRRQSAYNNIVKIETYIDILDHTDGKVFSNVASKIYKV